MTKLLSFSIGGKSAFGVLEDEKIFDLSRRLPDIPDLRALLGAGGFPRAKAALAGATVDYQLSDIVFAPVIPNPAKILCIGLNYEEHVAETQRPRTRFPTVFTRFADTLVGHGGAVIKPHHSSKVDYEAELAVIIGKPGRDIPRERAAEHVAGYACFNDVSVRDFQGHTSQFTAGKNFPGSAPFGPVLVSADELGVVGPQRIQSRLNGQVMQNAHLGEMIFPISELIAYISQWTPLAVGDVIATGTPGGVGMRRVPPVYMGDGDEIVVEIDGVGVLKNKVVAA
ncbi:MAG: fumarylacetoacetate hydrolase family protein [Proteobacteria bacterium]|nr:fumarylacetoacetate hydrolase family protein [Pseudomonadota bacterium]